MSAATANIIILAAIVPMYLLLNTVLIFIAPNCFVFDALRTVAKLSLRVMPQSM